jgi:integrating conjugative element protein (TIGR03749 family)
MKNLLKIIIPLTAIVLTFQTRSYATEIIHYENIPVTIELRQGEERTIHFGDHVQVGMTKGQQLKKLFRVQSAQGAIHLLPYQPFDKQRIQVKRLDGRVVLLDLIAAKENKNASPMEDVRIYLSSEDTVENSLGDEGDSIEPEAPIITPVDLTRFASQLLYGPSRLHKDVPGITETTLGVGGAIRLFKGANKYKTISKPVIAYQGGGYFLAGIHIKNISAEKVTLNYLELNVPFSHATFQHHSLNRNGSPGDSTVLYLISEIPLKEVLYPWTYYQDLKADALEKQRGSK